VLFQDSLIANSENGQSLPSHNHPISLHPHPHTYPPRHPNQDQKRRKRQRIRNNLPKHPPRQHHQIRHHHRPVLRRIGQDTHHRRAHHRLLAGERHGHGAGQGDQHLCELRGCVELRGVELVGGECKRGEEEWEVSSFAGWDILLGGRRKGLSWKSNNSFLVCNYASAGMISVPTKNNHFRVPSISAINKVIRGTTISGLWIHETRQPTLNIYLAHINTSHNNVKCFGQLATQGTFVRCDMDNLPTRSRKGRKSKKETEQNPQK